jgi:hypothetical protein
MPLASVRLRIQRNFTNADPVYWQWAVDDAEYDDASGLALVNATLTGVANGLGVGGSALIADQDADLIECFPGAGGPAYYVQGLAPGVPIGTLTISNQIFQCAVNELVQTPRGVSPRGRMFVGPLGNASNGVLTTSQREMAVDLMQNVAAAHIAAGFTPVVISRTLDNEPRPVPVGLPVLGFRADLRADILVSRRVPAPNTVEDYPLEPTP